MLEEAEGFVAPGALDGVTLMRYAHIERLRTSGGVEQYLRLLDHGLLARHRLTVIQMHLTRNEQDDSVQIENVGLGRIVWVPVPFRQGSSRLADLPKRIGSVYAIAKRRIEQERHSGQSALFMSLFQLLRNRGGHLRSKTAVLSDALEDVLARQSVSLLALHWLSYDTEALIRQAIKAHVPFVLINHFDNDRFSSKPVRRWINHSAGVGTVSSKNVPQLIEDRYTNLSDAVDTDFFSPARTGQATPAAPIIFLPARIDMGKGHLDLMRAARILHDRKFDFQICFAGAVDSPALQEQLQQFAEESGMAHQIQFLGEMTAKDLREWYARSSMVVLPTYSEGLGRVLLEAQSMGKPVVAYETGGTGEAVLPDVTGLLVQPGDISTLADRIGFLLRNTQKSDHMGQLGREFVTRRFSVSELIQRHEAFYVEALSGKRRHTYARQETVTRKASERAGI